MDNLLVTGSRGQLGNEFKNLASNYSNIKFFFRGSELDITNKLKIEKFIVDNKIGIIVNTAAYTNVEDAEIRRDKADTINSFAVKNLTELSEKYNCKLIHFSTDYVYDGNNIKPIAEENQINPLNYYGLSKRNGEMYIENSKSESIVIRTSWLYSYYGKNFVNTIINKCKNEKCIHIVNNQFGCPTYARDLALDTMNILSSGLKLDSKFKIYNYSNLGSTNWYNFAIKIIDYLNLDCEIIGISDRNLKLKAIRPKYSVTSKNKIIHTFKLNIPHWEKSLKNYLIKYYS